MNRWHNYLKPDVKNGEWSLDEDNAILYLQKDYGNNWSKLARMFPGRTDNAIKNRFHTLQRKAKQPQSFESTSDDFLFPPTTDPKNELQNHMATELPSMTDNSHQTQIAQDYVTTSALLLKLVSTSNFYNSLNEEFLEHDFTQDEWCHRATVSELSEFYSGTSSLCDVDQFLNQSQFAVQSSFTTRDQNSISDDSTYSNTTCCNASRPNSPSTIGQFDDDFSFLYHDFGIECFGML